MWHCLCLVSISGSKNKFLCDEIEFLIETVRAKLLPYLALTDFVYFAVVTGKGKRKKNYKVPNYKKKQICS